MALRRARARRPLKARVTAVSPKARAARASFCAAGSPALGAAQKGRPDLDQVGAPGQQLGDVVGPTHPACRHQRDQRATAHRCEERPDRPVLVGAVVVRQAGPVCPGLRSLETQSVRRHPERRDRLLGRRHGEEDGGARRLQGADDVDLGETEGEAHRRPAAAARTASTLPT